MGYDGKVTKRAHFTSRTFGDPVEAARIRALNEKRQQKEAVRPSSVKREAKKARWELRAIQKKLRRKQRRAHQVKVVEGGLRQPG